MRSKHQTMVAIAMKRIALMASLALALGTAGAAGAAKPESEAAVVARLYKDFAWQAIASQPDLFGQDVTHQPKATLERYFSPTLAALLVQNAACEVKSQEICNLESDILFDSQDPSITDLEVKKLASGKVSVAFTDPVSNKRTRIAFHLSQVAGKWRIADINYGNDRPSLLKTLRQIP